MRARASGSSGGPSAAGEPPDATPTLLTDPELDEVLAIDRALDRLDDRTRRVVEYRTSAGPTVEESTEALGVSTKTVQRTWRAARAWLRKEIGGTSDRAGA